MLNISTLSYMFTLNFNSFNIELLASISTFLSCMLWVYFLLILVHMYICSMCRTLHLNFLLYVLSIYLYCCAINVEEREYRVMAWVAATNGCITPVLQYINVWIVQMKEKYVYKETKVMKWSCEKQQVRLQQCIIFFLKWSNHIQSLSTQISKFAHRITVYDHIHSKKLLAQSLRD